MNLFDSDAEDNHESAVSAAPAISRSISDAERDRRVAEETARAEAAYLQKIQRQFGDGQPDDGSGNQDGGGGRKPRKQGRGGGFVEPDDDDNVDARGHMSTFLNRHGQKKSQWVKGAAPRDRARERQQERDRRHNERSRDEQPALGGGQNDHHDDDRGDEPEQGSDAEPEDDVPRDDEFGVISNGLGAAIEMPAVADLNSAFAAREWAALRLVLIQLLEWTEPRLRAEMSGDSEMNRSAVVQDIRALRAQVVRQLTRELVAALSLARTLAAKHHSWAIRSQLLDLVESVLTLFLYISPVAFETSPSSPHNSTSSAVALALLEIVHQAAILTPRITLLALRLARRILPTMEPDSLWRSFLAQQNDRQAAAAAGDSTLREPVITSATAAQWLVERIGALLTAESLALHEAEQLAAQQKRQVRRAELEASKMTRLTSKGLLAKSEDSKEPESKSDEKAPVLSPSPETPSVPAKTHALVVHYQDGVSSDKWTQILGQPQLLELAYGVRGILPPAEADLKARAQVEYERRQKARKGPAKVACISKSGQLNITPENKLASLTGFSTFVANVGVTSGKFYYQVQLHTRGLLQIGWATAEHQPSAAEGQGVGDDQHSWAYDGMRLQRWHGAQEPYSSRRWNTNDIVGCMLDLDVPGGEMRFFLNEADLGVAYKNFYTPELGPLYPAASLSTNECATFNFDYLKMQRKGAMRTRIPDGYSTLEGDRLTYSDPVPMRRAAEVVRATDFAGHFVLIESDFAFCDSMAKLLASEHGITATVQLIDHLDSLTLTDPSQPNQEVLARAGPAAFPQQKMSGAVAQAFASELVAFCRFLLDTKKTPVAQWSTQVASTLRESLSGSSALLASESSWSDNSTASNLLLGSICVMGGFTETVRAGGLVRIGAGEVGSTRGVVVQATEYAVQAVYLQELFNAAVTDAPSDLLAHKLELHEITPVSEFTLDLQQFSLDEQIFGVLQSRIEAQPPAIAEASSSSLSLTPASAAAGPLKQLSSAAQYSWLVGELKWRSVAVLESLLTNSAAPSALTVTRTTRSPSGGALDDGMLIRIGQLLVSHAGLCPHELKLDAISARYIELDQQAWNLRNRLDVVMAPVPYKRRRENGAAAPSSGASGSGAAISKPNPNSFETVYSSSSYQEEKIAAPVTNDALLRYWDRNIIPNIQNYVRGSFKPFEMEMYMAQLRQPLRQNNQPGAIEIALTLTGGHMPDGFVHATVLAS